MNGTGHDRGPVVVGFDGSVHAETAFRFAVEEAARQGLAVRVVVAHEPPDAWMAEYGLPLLADDGGVRQAVEDAARARIEEIRSGLDDPGRAVPVEVVAITGPAATVLVQAAQGASGLVVGNRGRGAVRSAVLGSVGLGVVLRAPCPVTVVPLAPRAQDTAVGDEAVLARPLPIGPVA